MLAFLDFSGGWMLFLLHKKITSPDALTKRDTAIPRGIVLIDKKVKTSISDFRTDRLTDGPVNNHAPAQGYKACVVAFCCMDGQCSNSSGEVVLD